MLPLAKAQGLAYVELTTEPDNIPSQRVIIANGGICHGRFQKTEHYGNSEGILYRIYL
jgi:predicted acetyltransferase